MKSIPLIMCLSIFVILFSSNFVLALSLQDPYPPSNSEIYLNPYPNNKINLSVKCTDNTTNIIKVYADLYDKNGFIGSYDLFLLKNNTYFTSSPPLTHGSYTIVFHCEDNSTNTSISYNFTLYSLELHINFPVPEKQEIVYPEGSVFISFEFNKLADTSQTIINPERFRLFLGDTEIHLSQSNYWINTTTGEWNIQSTIPNSISFGKYDVRVEGSYKGHMVYDTKSNAVDIRYPLSVEILSPTYSTPRAFIDGGEFVILAKILYKSNPIDNDEFGVNDFSIIIGEDIYTPDRIRRDEENPEQWRITVSIPKHDPGTYDLVLSVTYEGNTVSSEEKEAIQFVLPFKGTLIDAGGNIVGARIIFENIGKTITTNNLGVYEFLPGVIPGSYDLRLEFEDGKTIARFMGVKINKDTPDMSQYPYTIRYDTVPGMSMNIEGMAVAKTIVLEFGLPFDLAEITISYDDVERKIRDEMNIEVFTCHNWNFAARKCSGSWEKIDSYVDPVLNIVSFNVTKLSAFVIGERKKLTAEVNLDVREYTLGEPIQIKGKVTDSSGEPVEDAVVKFVVDKGNITTTTRTTFGGFYLGEITAPTEEGIFNLTVQVSKEPYIGYSTSFSLQAVKSKSLTFLNLPESIDIYLDTPQDIKFTILNSGQTPLKNIRLYAVGISTNWHQLIPHAINELGPGESREVTLKINVPTQDCVSGECKTYYSITLQAKSEEIEKEAVITATLKQKVISPKQQPKEEWLNFESLTGRIIGNEPGFYAGLSILIVLAFIFLTIKKKKSVSPNKHIPRQGVLFSFQSLKSHIFQKRTIPPKTQPRVVLKKKEDEELDKIIEDLE